MTSTCPRLVQASAKQLHDAPAVAASMIPVVARRHGSTLTPGECVVLGGPSGAGKSSILKMIYGNYRADAGADPHRHGRMAIQWIWPPQAPRAGPGAAPHTPSAMSRSSCAPSRASRLSMSSPRRRSRIGSRAATHGGSAGRRLLSRLNVPERLWSLPPVDLLRRRAAARQHRPRVSSPITRILLLDEPTASLDARNRAVGGGTDRGRRRRAGIAILGIFHDDDVRERVATRIVDVTRFAASAA